MCSERLWASIHASSHACAVAWGDDPCRFTQAYIGASLGNNYRRPVIGYAEDVAAVGRRELQVTAGAASSRPHVGRHSSTLRVCPSMSPGSKDVLLSNASQVKALVNFRFSLFKFVPLPKHTWYNHMPPTYLAPNRTHHCIRLPLAGVLLPLLWSTQSHRHSGGRRRPWQAVADG